jgi:esterase/lipase
MYPRAFVEKFLDDRYNNVERLKDYKGELIIVHGSKDPVVSDSQGQTLFQTIKSTNKEYITAKGYGHANIYPSQEMSEAVEQLVQ